MQKSVGVRMFRSTKKMVGTGVKQENGIDTCRKQRRRHTGNKRSEKKDFKRLNKVRNLKLVLKIGKYLVKY